MPSSVAELIIHIIMSYLIVLCFMYKIVCVIFSTNKQPTEIYNQINSRSDIPLGTRLSASTTYVLHFYTTVGNHIHTMRVTYTYSHIKPNSILLSHACYTVF